MDDNRRFMEERWGETLAEGFQHEDAVGVKKG